MSEASALVQPEIHAELISEALLAASVGFLVWDDERRYIAANPAACEILGTTLDELLGHLVGDHTVGGVEATQAALSKGFAAGEAVAKRFDDSGTMRVLYATFETSRRPGGWAAKMGSAMTTCAADRGLQFFS